MTVSLAIVLRTEIFLGLLLFSFGWNTESCPSHCVCSETNKYAECINNDLNSIPKFPSYVRNLRFNGNKLVVLSNETFRNIEELTLIGLELVNNSICNITENAFSNLHHLVSLNISSNPSISIDSIARAAGSISNRLFSTFVANGMPWNKEPVELYRSLSHLSLTKLELSHSFFKTLNITAIGNYLPNLINLTVSFGSISKLYPGFLGNIQNLELQYNYIEISEETFGDRSHCFFPELKSLRLDSNFINDFQNISFCLGNLEYLNLDKNPVKKIKNDTFYNLHSLKHLSVSNLGDRLFQIQSTSFRSNSLISLQFANNQFNFSGKGFNFDFDKYTIFKDIPNLSILDLSGNYFDLSSDVLTEMILPTNASLKTLILNQCSVLTLPTGLLYKMQNLTQLIMSNNKILTWNGTAVFGGQINKGIALRKLVLRENIISIINASLFPQSTIKHLTEIDLRLNPFSCDCGNLWFTNMIKRNKSVFTKFPTNYECNSPADKKGEKLSNFNPTSEECSNKIQKIFKIVMMSLSLCGIFLVTVASILYKIRWHIRYWLYLSRVRSKGYFKMADGQIEYVYNGFVIYCDEDTNWVRTKLLSHVENEAGLKLCIHHRDFDPGSLIVDNIVKNMSISKHILLVISLDLVKSGWCLFETRVAQERFLNNDNDALTIIMLENVSKNEMPASVRFLVDSTTYIQWPRKEYDEERFWTEVVKSISRE